MKLFEIILFSTILILLPKLLEEETGLENSFKIAFSSAVTILFTFIITS
jgi:hypothetical protein